MMRVSESAAIIKRVLAESRCAVCGGALLYQGRPQRFVCVSSDAHDADPRFDRMVALARFRKLSERAKRERLLFLTRFGRLISREDGGWRPARR